MNTSGPFDNSDTDCRITALRLALECLDKGLCDTSLSIVALAGVFAEFIIDGKVADDAPSEAALAYAVAYRALKEEIAHKVSR